MTAVTLLMDAPRRSAATRASRNWLSAVGVQPQDNTLFTATYPWLGIRIGVLGELKVAKG